MITEHRHRFLRAIGERVAADLVAEVRLFPSIRQGAVESGVAVVAADSAALAAMVEPPGDDVPISDPSPAAAPVTTHPERLSILTARYRLTLKGPDRGRWEFNLVHDADAPLETLEQVVRGVARRVGEDGEPDLLTGGEFARTIAEPWWNASA